MTHHTIHFQPAKKMKQLADSSVNLVVTSPPYPMVGMWDEMFFSQDGKIRRAFESGDYRGAFELMHAGLDEIWAECFRVLKDGGMICINIGDATRTLSGNFSLYPNQARVVQACHKIGFHCLPGIIWKKRTNAPNKFMGSGMLPTGAYVTLEHEFILIFRKGKKRGFKNGEKQDRRRSAYFWEERNIWFSDIWEIEGTAQKLPRNASRTRSAAYPLQVPYRLINMFSVQGDVVLDPFMGTGTTLMAAMAAGRNSIGFEIDPAFARIISERVIGNEDGLNRIVEKRLRSHRQFIGQRKKAGRTVKHKNEAYAFPVVTKQETSLQLPRIKRIEDKGGNSFKSTYLC